MSKVKLNDVAFEAKAKYKAVEGVPIKTVGLEHLTPSDIDLNDYAIGAKTTFAKGFSKDDILFGRRRAYQKKAAIAPFDGVCSSDITVIRAIDGAINKKLLPFIIQNEYFFDYAMRNSAGSMSPRVKWAQLGEFEFELPSPSRQDELVNLLWAIQEARRDYKAIIDECGNVIKSQFVEMFGGQDWKLLPLSSCVSSIDTGRSINCEEGSRDLGGFGVLKLSALSSGLFLPSENKAIPKQDFIKEKEINKGDLLFARKNTPELVGMTVYVSEETEGLMFPDLVFRMKPVGINALYLLSYMKSDHGFELIRRMAHGSARSMVNIPKTQLATLPVPVPPLSLQQEFADFVAEIDKSKFDTRKALKSLNSTSNAILNEELGLNHG